MNSCTASVVLRSLYCTCKGAFTKLHVAHTSLILNAESLAFSYGLQMMTAILFLIALCGGLWAHITKLYA